MATLKYMINKMRDVKIGDVASVLPMITAKIVSPLFAKKYTGSWLICEEPQEARDNGYWFFKYMCENHPEKDCYYAIANNSVDYHKVKQLGNIVEFGSLKHWILYFLCEYNISSQKGGKPNAPLCAFLELNHLSNVKNVFLQHGVTINNARWLYADRSSFTFFITATTDETEYIKTKFGYPDNVVQYTGFSRFDNLHDNKVVKNRILIMPSWRAWFREKTSQESKADADFEHSEYYTKWKELISCDQMKELIKNYKLEVIFFPHRNMQPYLSYFEDIDTGVVIGSAQRYDVQELLKSSQLMITDYSSVFFDMVYMKKPVIFYQFDEEKFRRQQYQEGYFDYHNSPFGPVFSEYEGVLIGLEQLITDNYQVSEKFLKEHKRVFSLLDKNNSERIYQLLISK